ncbi:MAG: LysR family transcriptional regulator [Coriobacteriales bacterium]|jgi:DNA-binding transcriptional LysR family regulator
MDAWQMRVAVVSAETGSFNRAAEELFTTPQTVKNQIDTLELELERRLFIRSKKGVTLTSEGECFCHHARLILREIDLLTQDVRSVGAGGIRLACENGSYQPMRDEMCSAYAAAHQASHLTYVVCNGRDDVLARIRAGLVDASFLAEDACSPNDREIAFFPCENLPRLQACVLVSRDSPLAAEESVGWTSLDRLPLFRDEVDPIETLGKEAAGCGSVMRAPVVTDRYEVINRCASGEVYLTSNYRVIDYGGLVAVPVGDADAGVAIGVVTRRDPMPDVRAMVEFFRSYCPSRMPDDLRYQPL